MRKSTVWIGVVVIIIGLVIYIIAFCLSDVAAGKYITAIEENDDELAVQYFVDARTADRIGVAGSVLLFLGIAFSFAGTVLEPAPQPQPLPPSIKTCLECFREIPSDAIICPYCRHSYEKSE